MIRTALASIGVLALALTAQPAAAQESQTAATGPATVKVEKKDQLGQYLTDADGRALYMFTADGKGRSDCYDACAQAWPPLLTEGEPQAAENADDKKLGTTERRDGTTQVTYNGWPLYYYVKDQAAGATTGQDVHGFGGEWYLVNVRGEKVESESGKSGDRS